MKRRRSGFLLPIIGGLIGSVLTVGALWLGGVFENDVPITAGADSADVVVTSNPVDETVAGAMTITPLDGNSRVATVAARAIPSIVTVEVGDNITVPSGGATESVFHAFATGSGRSD